MLTFADVDALLDVGDIVGNVVVVVVVVVVVLVVVVVAFAAVAVAFAIVNECSYCCPALLSCLLFVVSLFLLALLWPCLSFLLIGSYHLRRAQTLPKWLHKIS